MATNFFIGGDVTRGPKGIPPARRVPTKELADAITKTRVHLGLNKAEFARKMKRNFVTIHRWETGRIVPQPATLEQLAMWAPKAARRVFEDYLNKSYEQILREGRSSAGTPTSPDWKADPVQYADDIFNAGQEWFRSIWLEAKGGRKAAAASLAWIFEQILHEIDRLEDKNGRPL